MARAAMAAGIRTIAATPHLRADFPGVDVRELEARCQALRSTVAEQDVRVELVSGGDASLAWALEASDEEVALGSYGRRGTDLLIEAPGDVTQIERLLYQLRARGLRITLAHPERSPSFQREARTLHALSEQGVRTRWRRGRRPVPAWQRLRRPEPSPYRFPRQEEAAVPSAASPPPWQIPCERPRQIPWERPRQIPWERPRPIPRRIAPLLQLVAAP